MKAKVKSIFGEMTISGLNGYLLRFNENVHQLISYYEGVGFKYDKYNDNNDNIAYGLGNNANEIVIIAESDKTIKERIKQLPPHVVVKKYKENSIIEVGLYSAKKFLYDIYNKNLELRRKAYIESCG